MRSVLIGAVEGTDVALLTMQRLRCPPVLLATFSPEIGRSKHADFVDLAALCDKQTRVEYVADVNSTSFIELLKDIAPDVLFVIGWSQLISSELRSVARIGTVGFHPTPLPKLRGRAPIAWTILSGATRSGTSLFLIDGGVDTGAILAQDFFELSERETASSLIEKNKVSLGRALEKLLPELASGNVRAVPQSPTGASYGARRSPEDAMIDWHKPAKLIDRLIRAQGAPYAGAYTFTRRRKITIWAAESISMRERYYGNIGQIVFYDNGCPVVLCGENTLLRVDDYSVEGGGADFRLSGQIRFRDRTMGSAE